MLFTLVLVSFALIFNETASALPNENDLNTLKNLQFEFYQYVDDTIEKLDDLVSHISLIIDGLITNSQSIIENFYEILQDQIAKYQEKCPIMDTDICINCFLPISTLASNNATFQNISKELSNYFLIQHEQIKQVLEEFALKAERDGLLSSVAYQLFRDSNNFMDDVTNFYQENKIGLNTTILTLEIMLQNVTKSLVDHYIDIVANETEIMYEIVDDAIKCLDTFKL